MSGVEMIRKERSRQRRRTQNGEAYSLSNDDEHDRGELAAAAALYALPPEVRRRNHDLVDALTPFGWYLKLASNDRIRELEKAGALIAAEIDRLLRLEAKPEAPKP